MVIWEFELEITDMQEVRMPEGAELLSVANQSGKLCLWAMVDPSKEKRCHRIEIFGTGHPIPVDMGIARKFIGTAVVDPFVWHVFERRFCNVIPAGCDCCGGKDKFACHCYD